MLWNTVQREALTFEYLCLFWSFLLTGFFFSNHSDRKIDDYITLFSPLLTKNVKVSLLKAPVWSSGLDMKLPERQWTSSTNHIINCTSDFLFSHSFVWFAFLCRCLFVCLFACLFRDEFDPWTVGIFEQVKWVRSWTLSHCVIGWLVIVLKLLPEAFCNLLKLRAAAAAAVCARTKHRMYHVHV